MADLQRVESMQYPAGHAAHLTPNQQEQLRAFTALCRDQGYYTPATKDTPPSHDDETLLRFLRARRFIPDEAFKQFRTTEDWRKDQGIDALFDSIDAAEYEQTRRLVCLLPLLLALSSAPSPPSPCSSLNHSLPH